MAGSVLGHESSRSIDDRIRIAVVGAGDIGRRHMQAIAGNEKCSLCAIVDPMENGPLASRQFGAPFFSDIVGMIDAIEPDGVVIAAPNSLHVSLADLCIDRRIPILIEKPITENVASAYALAARAEANGVPVLVGHHRRHNPVVRRAHQIIDQGTLGEIAAVSATWMVRKPEEYFAVGWRKEPGGGPILINLIHDIDNLRHLVGEIVAVQAVASNRWRGYPVEDTAAVILNFACGALGAIVLSDATPSPWSWELTAGEVTSYAYPKVAADCYLIAGSLAAMALPSLRIWRHDGQQSWRSPLIESRLPVEEADPLALQISHFLEVIQAGRPPLVGALDAARTLEVTLAVTEAALTRALVEIPVRHEGAM